MCYLGEGTLDRLISSWESVPHRSTELNGYSLHGRKLDSMRRVAGQRRTDEAEKAENAAEARTLVTTRQLLAGTSDEWLSERQGVRCGTGLPKMRIRPVEGPAPR